MSARLLVLFDIDGTLIRRAGPHHKRALIEAVRVVTSLETSLDDIPTGGTLDSDLIRLMLLSAGATPAEIAKGMPQIIQEAQRLYVESCPDLQHAVCPGVPDLLQKLREAELPVGLVTGNLSAIGWRKVEMAGLRPYFQIGAFSEMAATRADLVGLAMQEAQLAGIIRPGARACLIGDHMNDVEAAKLNRIRSIAVATGIASREELSALQPDLLVDDLRSLTIESLFDATDGSPSLLS